MNVLLKSKHGLVLSNTLREVLQPYGHLDIASLLALLIFRESSQRLLLGASGRDLVAHHDINRCLSHDLGVAGGTTENFGKISCATLGDCKPGG